MGEFWGKGSNRTKDAESTESGKANIPISKIEEEAHGFHAAADGQLGCVMKCYRDWRISRDTGWIKSLWTQIRQSIKYYQETWDPDMKGILVEPHHNTYDIEFWGPDGMCSSFYLGALKATALIADALEEDASFYNELYKKGINYLESLFQKSAKSTSNDNR